MIDVLHHSRLLIIALLPPLLAGCFMSAEPRFPLASAAAPFGAEARIGLYERGEDKSFKRQEMILARRRSDGAYDFINEKGEATVISLHDVGGGRFVGQSKTDKDKPGYGYIVFSASGREFLIYLPDCGEQDKALLKRFGVETPNQDECLIDRVSDPAGLFAAVELGEPTSKMVRE